MPAGVGTPGDVTLHKEEELQEPDVSSAALKTTRKAPTRRSFFTARQLNPLAVVIVLSASGLVDVDDFAFVIFSILYMYFISKVAFPATSPHSEPPVYGEKNTILSLYILLGAWIGLFLPIAYIFEGMFEGDKEGIKPAAPHVFLLASQVFLEGLSFSGGFSLPIRVFVPVFYNSRRIFSIMEWVRSEISKVDVGYGSGSDRRRLYAGRALAVANMVFWSFNLFGFLLPFYLPKAFKIYYSSSKNKD